MQKPIFTLVNVFICITFFTNTVKAEIIDCINHLVPLSVSREQAEQACTKACQFRVNSSSSRELYRLCKIAQTGNGNTIYYSNGRVMTNYAGKEGATWYYSNGQIMTNYAGKEGATWYYLNGQIMTSNGNIISKEEILYPCSYIE